MRGFSQRKPFFAWAKRDFSSIAFISLGSNLGNKFSNIFKACNHLTDFSNITKTSQLYYSPCINVDNEIEKNENYFINAVVKIETELDYKKLLIQCKRIEKIMDRKAKSIQHEARTIDLDILLFNQELINNEKLFTEENVELHINLPHVRLSERLFVLKPLCDIDPSQEHYSRKSNKNKSFCEELFDNFIKTDNNPKAEFYHYENYLNFQKEINAITNLDYLNSILVFSAQSKPALAGEKEALKETEQKEFFILDCKEFIIKQKEQQNEQDSTQREKDDKQSNLTCVRAKYENIKKHFIQEVYFTMKDKSLKKDADQQAKKYLSLLSLKSFDEQIKNKKEAYELIQSNISRLIEKHKMEKKDFDLQEKQITKTAELINEFMFFDILEIEDFNFIKNYLNNKSFYETRELNEYFKDMDIVKIQLLNHARKNNLKVVVYTTKSNLQANNHTDNIRNSIDEKIKALEDFGIYNFNILLGFDLEVQKDEKQSEDTNTDMVQLLDKLKKIYSNLFVFY